jgi:hypothetical protein
VFSLLAMQVLGLNSQHGVEILIKGEDAKSKEPNLFDVHLSHKLLRENKKLEDLSSIDRKLLEYEQKIKFHRLDKGKQEIEELRKMLDGVSVYQGFKVQKSTNMESGVSGTRAEETKDPAMIRFQPQKVAEI